jgi:hypothetical protein
MTRLDCLPSGIDVHRRHVCRVRSEKGFSAAKRERSLRVRSISGSILYSAGSPALHRLNRKQGELFCIRNSFWILRDNGAPDLGSGYGNRPYRSSREPSVPYPCSGHRAQRHRVCQHVGQNTSQRLIHHLIRSGAACAGLLLWRRSGWRDVSVCASQDASRRFTDGCADRGLLLWRRSGRRDVSLCAGQESAQHFADSGADRTGLLLWRRSGWRNLPVCASQESVQHFADSGVDRTGLLLRRRSGWRDVSLCASPNCDDRDALIWVGRLSNQGGGQ